MNRIDEIITILDEDNSLAIGQSPWEPDINHEKVEIIKVDWNKLFPRRSPSDRGREYDWEVYGDEWENNIELTEEIFDNPSISGDVRPEAWDVCAWYQPIHFHAYDWGIFIKEECLRRLASKIYLETGINARHLSPSQRRMLAKGILRTSIAWL